MSYSKKLLTLWLRHFGLSIVKSCLGRHPFAAGATLEKNQCLAFVLTGSETRLQLQRFSIQVERELGVSSRR